MNLAQLDLNLLVTLDALLRERNVTRAGRRVGLSQPAMSAALRRLRDVFGDELLVRRGLSYQLTPLANELSESVQEILVLVERTLNHRVGFEPRTARREFRIAASDYWTLVLGPPLLAYLRDEAPHVRLRFQQLRDDGGRLLSARRVDLVVYPVGALPGFESQVLFEDPWTCVFWKGNTAVGKRLDKKTFEALPHLTFSFGRGAGSAAERHLDGLGVTRRTEITVESFVASAFLLTGTSRLALIPRRLALRLQGTTDTRLLPPPYPIPNLVEAMCWNPLDTPDAAHAWLRGAVAKVAGSL